MADFQQRHLLNFQALRSPLPALMELDESLSPPPVPPKDEKHQNSMNAGYLPTAPAPASGSKRKREDFDDNTFNPHDRRPERGDLQHTPSKRSRSCTRSSNGDLSNDETPMPRGLRRKTGNRNLTNLNVRHAASLANIYQRQPSPGRESRFHEGSLTDKPSKQPPSVFTDGAASKSIEELMDHYNETPTEKEPFPAFVANSQTTPEDRDPETATRTYKENNGGVFRFGRSLAAAFHPMALWNRLWTDQKQESALASTEEFDRKAQQKDEVGAKYAELKDSGELGLYQVSTHTPCDSAIVLDGRPLSQRSDQDPQLTSGASSLHETLSGHVSHDKDEAPESAAKTLHRFASRLHLRKPSFQNLQAGLKRVRSDLSLGNDAARESFSSTSPVKRETGDFSLRKSRSKYDLKKQHKLSKRVSDLEAKLEKARSELNTALEEASPKPNLPNKFQKFTPSGTGVRKPRFVPGALPTLPSEGVLFPQQLQSNEDKATAALASRTWETVDRNEAFEVNVEVTATKDNGENVARGTDVSQPLDEIWQAAKVGRDSEVDITAESGENAARSNKDVPKYVGDHEQVETSELLSATGESTKKLSKNKKRTCASEVDGLFKPDTVENDDDGDNDDDDDDEWDQAIQKSKKKRKPASRPKGSSSEKQGMPSSKSAKTIKSSGGTPDVPVNGETADKAAAVLDTDESDDELNMPIPLRVSLISNEELLEPVYEVEEEAVSSTWATPIPKLEPTPSGRNNSRRVKMAWDEGETVNKDEFEWPDDVF